jgi:hypothetical protein
LGWQNNLPPAAKNQPERFLNEVPTIIEKGKLNTSIIDRWPGVACVNVYARRFGRLLKAYDLIGYRAPAPDSVALKARFQTLILR